MIPKYLFLAPKLSNKLNRSFLIVILLNVVIYSVISTPRRHSFYRKNQGIRPTKSPYYQNSQSKLQQQRQTKISGSKFLPASFYPFGNSSQFSTAPATHRRDQNSESHNMKGPSIESMHTVESPNYGYGATQGYGYEYIQPEKEAQEKDDTVDRLAGVIGPLLFPIPFVLAILPFSLVAIPLSFLLPFGNATTDNRQKMDRSNTAAETILEPVTNITKYFSS